MKILSLDTSSSPVFAAVEVNAQNQIVQSHAQVLEEPRQMSRAIISAMSAALDETNWKLDDLDAIAVGIGPGSWTGLRVGLSTAKTLAQTRDLPLFGIPTFDAYALAAKSAFVCDYCLYYAVLTCRKGEIYTKTWQTRDQKLTLREGERIVSFQSVADEILADAPPWIAFIADASGSNAVREMTALLPAYGTQIIEVTPQILACHIAQLAAARLQNSERDDPLTLAPLYLAPSSAERVRAEKLEKAAREMASEAGAEVEIMAAQSAV